jgi:predicted RNase H-like HicB family nuclease
MKQFVYPVVLYLDKDTNYYTVAFHDLDIYAEGTTVEDAFLNAKEFLKAYFECLVKFGEEADEASEFLKIADENLANIVLLVDAEVEE